MRRTRAGIAALFGLLLVLAGAPAASLAAEDVEVHPAIAQALQEIPGGIVVDAEHAVWPRFEMEISVVADREAAIRAVGSCGTGLICAYSGYGLTTMYATWGVCGVLPAPSAYTMKSFADARSSGYAQARNGTTVLATAAAGSWSNVYGSVTNIRCVL